MQFKNKITAFLLAATLLASGVLSGCSGKDTITVGGKDYGENNILSEMFAQLIETHTDLKVNRKLNMGGTFVCFEALKNGDIDIYPEYTGTGLTAQLHMDVITDPDEAYRVASEEFDKQFDIKWLKPVGFNNTYALAVTNDVYEEYGIETYSDLVEISKDLVFGAEHEFFNRPDGFDGLSELYGLEFKGDPKKMNVALKYQAIGNEEIDVTNAFTTDGPVKQYNLKILEDDKNFFPPYYPAPIIRKDTLEKYPELEDVLNALSGKIDDEAMTEMNYKVDVEGQDIEAVATEFLEANGML